jgi:hypothetical protein
MGILFKTQHWPPAALMLAISVMSAVFLFLPSLLYSKLADKDQANKRPVYILGFISMIIYLASFWFKVQHWPLATVLMTISSFILMVIVLPWYTWITWKEEKNISNSFIYMVIAIALFVIPGALVSLSMQNQYDAEFFIHQDQQKAIVNYRLKSNEKLLMAYKDSIEYNKLSLIHLKTTDLIGKIDQVELKMIELSEETPSSGNTPNQAGSAPDKEIQYNYLKNPYNGYIVKFMLSPGADSRTGLDKSIKSYTDFISENTSIEFVKSYASVLNPSVYLPDTNPYIGESILISGLHALELLRNGILLTENAALRLIISH